ncbi:DUF885 family protein [Sphingomonas sp. GB1N7]|uniref:DUF885 family protein n=1 Tax=Parasphingomonas caseinilytica TaxID=3096158 RepID=UPI002FCC6953
MTARLSRRAVIVGGLARLCVAAPARAASSADDALRALLDAVAGGADRLAEVRRFPESGLSPSSRLDLRTVRAGLVIDAELARRFPDPKGAMSPARYGLLLRRITGDDTDPAEALERLEHECRALLAEADRRLKTLGLASGTVGARFTTLWRDPRWLYADDDAGRNRAVADMNRALVSARHLTIAAFPGLAPRCLNVGVHRMSAADAAAGRGGYRDLPTAGVQGNYTVDLKDIRRRPSWTLTGVVHHELLPGHMVQMPTEAIAAPHPLRLKYAPGFAEGWAIHAEQFAADRGAFVDDAMGMIGHLHWMLFRIGRALADLRIHLSGWSIERAREQLVAWQGEPAYFAPFNTDLARIAAEPAVRVAEALAWLTIADLARIDSIKAHRIALAHGRMRNDELRRIMHKEASR